ncbi:MAG: hypothetical protein HY275_01345, partial [Gemmatimonadetes bacterium]|nr:hypothetical protein [Gemmatimonadota bacterium]
VRAYLAAPHDPRAAANAARAAFAPARMVDGYLRVYAHGSASASAAERVPSAETAHELAVLRDHLVQQRTWRARVARRESVDLARLGFRGHALGALALTLREDPREFLKGVALKQVAQAAAAMLRPAVGR